VVAANKRVPYFQLFCRFVESNLDDIGDVSLCHFTVVSQLHHVLRWYTIGVSQIVLIRENHWRLYQHWIWDRRYVYAFIRVIISLRFWLYRLTWFGWVKSHIRRSTRHQLIRDRGNAGPSWPFYISVYVTHHMRSYGVELIFQLIQVRYIGVLSSV